MLHAEARRALIQRAIRALGACRFIPDGISEIPAQELNELCTTITKHVGEWAFEQGIYFLIAIYFRSRLRILASSGAPGEALGDVRAHDVHAIATSLVDWVESLPHALYYYFPLPMLQEFGANVLEVSERVSIVNIEHGGTYDGLSVVEREAYKSNDTAECLIAGCRYLRVKGVGYHWLGDLDESAPLSAFSTARRFLALSEAVRVLKVVSGPADPITAAAVAGPTFYGNQNDMSLNDSFARQLATYQFDSSVLQRRRSLLDVAEGETGTVQLEGTDRASVIRKRLEDIAVALNADAKREGISTLLTASEWYFDANSESNQTISFLQLCIGFEALLGDPGLADERGITATLADRLAFLLGRNVAERVELRKKMKDFYRERSKLVHGRAARLNPNDSHLVGVENAS